MYVCFKDIHGDSPGAAVLSDKDKVWFGDQSIEQAKHFSHYGDEGDAGGFSFADQSLVKLSEDTIVLRRRALLPARRA